MDLDKMLKLTQGLKQINNGGATNNAISAEEARTSISKV